MMCQAKHDLPILSFENQESWEGWLEKHHADSVGIWLKLAKKDSNIPSVGYDEAVESALYCGWIDSQNASFDSQYVITHPSSLYPPFPKFWEGGKEAGKQESAGKTTCGFLFSDYLHSNLCR